MPGTSAPHIITIETRGLGDRGYVVHDGVNALVVDPQRDTDRVERVLAEHGLTLTHVAETHIHNDYVSGGLVLAQQLGAVYVVPAGYELAYEAEQLADGDTFTSGRMQWRAIHTPGHTPQHLSYAVAVDGADAAAFTGGSMLFGSVGRPDLIGPAHTHELAHAQWKSVRRLAEEVAGTAAVMPTHGFGSFCAATATVGLESTIAQQAAANPAFLVEEDEFVAELIAGLDAFPAYYAHMGPANQAGAGPVNLSLPQRASADEIARRIAAGEWVVDLRHRRLFSGEHVQGSLSFDVHGNAVTYLGWLIDWGTPITLLGADVEEVQAMQRELVRIGIDRPIAYATGQPSQWVSVNSALGSYRRATHADMAAALAVDPDLPMLDLRRNSEFENGYVRGAKHLPLHELRSRMGEVASWARANGEPVWVYCGSGFRASIGASLMEAAGLTPVHVDDDFANAAKAGLQIAIPDRHARLGDAYLD